jgi:predicted RND superfamily exporter protein
MYPTRINTDAMPVNLALLITGIGVAVIVLVIVGASVVDRVDKAKDRRSRK